MNRLEHDVLPLGDTQSSSRIQRAQRQSQATTDPSGLSVFAPLHYEPQYAYPLLVWLHGEGQNENQLRCVMPRISMRNYAAVAPRGTIDVPGNSHSDAGERFTWCQSDRHVQSAIERVSDAIHQATERMNIQPQRIFLAGSGGGGTMAFRVALKMPDRFGGVLSLGGPFPTGNAPLASLLDARRLPLFVAVNRDSSAYPDSTVCANLRLFHTAGMAVNLRQYPGSENLADGMLTDVDRWIMATISEQQDVAVVAT